MDVRAAAQLMAERRAIALTVDGDGAHFASVAVAKERQRAGGQRVLNGLHLRLHEDVANNARVDGVCHGGNLVLR